LIGINCQPGYAALAIALAIGMQVAEVEQLPVF
jgi:hypothetical protein